MVILPLLINGLNQTDILKVNFGMGSIPLIDLISGAGIILVILVVLYLIRYKDKWGD